MNDTRYERLREICDAETSRDVRAREAAGAIAGDRYRWVAIYEVEDDSIRVLGEFATSSRSSNAVVTAEALATAAFVTIDDAAIVPILGAESGVVMGALAVEHSRAAPYDEEERGVLERYAAIVIALFE